MAEPTFDRAAFESRLATRHMGRTLIARAETGSTNTLAWDSLAERPVDGLAVVADAQLEGRGRLGRRWETAPGKGLALSLVLFRGCDLGTIGLLPLAAGLGLARMLEERGLMPELKWPNDTLLGGRKVAGVLCESRALEPGSSERAVVVGVGVNVGQLESDFPGALRHSATSLLIEGVVAPREEIAAGFLNAFEPVWDALAEGGGAELIELWTRRARCWDRAVTVHTPQGPVAGVARRLDAEGRLVLERADGERFAVTAGDVEDPAPGAETR